MKQFIKHFLFASLFLLALPALADGPTQALKWVDAAGVIAFTDDTEMVPEKYRADVEIIALTGLENLKRATIPDSEGEAAYAAGLEERLAYFRQVNANSPVNPNRLNDCTGHVLVTSQRMQLGDYNRRIFFATDECGRTRSVTSFSPDVQINR